jgi:2-keto-4-pentenoate hydratase/2-oxohepta-3-ene-1,7-dioic acid hydratase in catechol pathway
MRICRFNDNRLGLVRGSNVVDVTPALDLLPSYRWPVPYGDALMANLDAVGRRAAEIAASRPSLPLADVKLLSPVANASKIIAAPVNYMKHVDEARADKGINFGADIKTIDHYGLFLKSNTSVIGAGEHVLLPAIDRRMDHEVEVAAVIGVECYQVPRERALDMICGYTIALDMSVRGPEDRSWRKSYDTFSVLGPWLATPDEIGDSGDLDLSLSVNGQERQRSNTKALIFDIPKLIAYASQAYRLYPGDVIMTGTPEGVGPVAKGDIMTCAVEKIGSMRVVVD